MKRALAAVVALLFAVMAAPAQTSPQQVRRILEPAIQTGDVAALQLRQYLIGRVPALPPAPGPEQWAAQAKRLRKHLLEHVVFHGWPREWVETPLKVEDLGVAFSGPGYRARKLRYEIVPGMQSTAILYEPEALRGKAPAVLNVNGHVGKPGKSVEYKQKRCIQFARHGILALNLEWLAFGELTNPENAHWFGGHLDLAGANTIGLFYLAMRRGLDYLYGHPDVDRARLGVTGLSGGGWQTIVLSALDERVSVAVPVAGYASLVSRIERPEDAGDLEQNATDLVVGSDYPYLTAMRAPRPTLLIYNAEDDCCFRAPLVKPYIFDNVKPFFRVFGAEDAFAWHENTDPSDHNYQLDNRVEAYRFFGKHFGVRGLEDEAGVAAEIRSYDELVVGLPKDNLTILGLARKLASEIRREPVAAEGTPRAAWAPAEREKLKRVVRFTPVEVRHAWAVANTKAKGLESESYRFELSNGLGAAGVWLKAIAAPADAPVTIILNDKGRKSAGVEVSERLNRGEQVLALDLVFNGDATPEPNPVGYAQMLATTGDRPLGIQAAQLLGIAAWLARRAGVRQARLESDGLRNQVAALVAAALQPELFSHLEIREGMPSLKRLLDEPVTYQSAPALFCLDLYKEFDLDRLAALAAPATVSWPR